MRNVRWHLSSVVGRRLLPLNRYVQAHDLPDTLEVGVVVQFAQLVGVVLVPIEAAGPEAWLQQASSGPEDIIPYSDDTPLRSLLAVYTVSCAWLANSGRGTQVRWFDTAQAGVQWKQLA